MEASKEETMNEITTEERETSKEKSMNRKTSKNGVTLECVIFDELETITLKNISYAFRSFIPET